ncbi:MAG: D-alanyl-D-alanine carboxypeptidase family protein, partial [Clostridia bacterium]|nr:D-alanyl-D-alanine carboxypeptidase family protein [Clostridia bacterium]
MAVFTGQSEHQTGLAIDIECYYKGNYDEDIADLGEIDWMRDNA